MPFMKEYISLIIGGKNLHIVDCCGVKCRMILQRNIQVYR